MPADDRLLTRLEAEEHLARNHGLRVNLARRAMLGSGPEMIKYGDGLPVAYRVSRLDAWVAGRVRVVSTGSVAGSPLSSRELAELMRLRREQAEADAPA